jgi:hypothetical protein
MDVIIDRSYVGNVKKGTREETSYRNGLKDVKSVIFLKMDGIIPPGISYVDSNMVETLNTLYSEIEDIRGMSIYLTILNECDPASTTLNIDDHIYTRDYYIVRSLDITYNLIPKGGKVLTATPKARKYFSELSCTIYNAFYLQQNQTLKNRLTIFNTSLKSNSPHDDFLAASRHLFVVDTEFDLGIRMDNVQFKDRWNLPQFNKGIDQVPVDLIIVEENPEGRTVGEIVRNYDQQYNVEFSESMIQFLLVLKNGGNAIVYFYTLGSSHISQWVYLYSLLFEEIVINKPLSTNFIGLDHCMVGRKFKKAVFERMYKPISALISGYSGLSMSCSNGISHPPIINVKDDNFDDWLLGINNSMMWYIISQVENVVNAIDERRLGYRRSTPLLNIDSSKILHHYDLVYSPQRLYSMYNILTNPEVINLKAPTMDDIQLTDTGQAVRSVNSLLSTIVNKIDIKLVIFMSFEHGFLSHFMTNFISYFRNTLKIYTIEGNVKYEMINLLRKWFHSVFFGEGDMEIILNNPKEIEALVKMRGWNYFTIFGYVKTEYSNVDIVPLISQSFYKLNEVATYVKTMNPDDLHFELSLLKSMRYRFSYSWNGFRHSLQFLRSYNIIGDEQIYNLLSIEERSNIKVDDLHLLTKSKPFALRVANEICFLVLMGQGQDMVKFDMMKYIDEYDAALSSNVWHRDSLIWGTDYMSSEFTGSLGDFTSFTSSSEHSLYSDLSIENLLLFPPVYDHKVKQVMDGVTKLFTEFKEKNRALRIYIILHNDTKDTHETLCGEWMSLGITIDPPIEPKGVSRLIDDVYYVTDEYKIYSAHWSPPS